MKKYALAALLMGSMTVGFTSCESLTQMGVNPFEEKQTVMATCVAAPAPHYHPGGDSFSVGGGSARTDVETKPFWSQEVTVRTKAGRLCSGSLIVAGPWDRVRKGQRELAVIGVNSGKLWSFGGRKAQVVNLGNLLPIGGLL